MPAGSNGMNSRARHESIDSLDGISAESNKHQSQVAIRKSGSRGSHFKAKMAAKSHRWSSTEGGVMIRSRRDKVSAALCVVALSVMTSVSAHTLATQSTAEERRLAGISTSTLTTVERLLARWSVSAFVEPVHEEITNRIYGCNGDICTGSEATSAPVPVLAGVRWNDDPPFRMTSRQARGIKCKTQETIRFETQPGCWVALFLDAKKRASNGEAFGPEHAMLYRSHFGDLQYLHAMASRNGEPAWQTKARIMGWFEFSWRASLGEYSLETRLKDIGNPAIQSAFGHGEWRLLDLYTLGASGGLRRHVGDVAFGSLLHTLQDSYAAGHVDREEAGGIKSCSVRGISVAAPGNIREFHAYNDQDHELHAAADSRDSFMRSYQVEGNVVDVGRLLVRARDQKVPWEEISGFFDCIFTLQRPEASAGPGDFVSAS